MKIGIIGAGNVGGNLGVRLSKSGFDVRFGLKDNKDAAALLARCDKSASAGTVEEAAKADVVFLAVPGTVAVDVAKSLAKTLEGKIVVDCNNALTWKEGPEWNPPAAIPDAPASPIKMSAMMRKQLRSQIAPTPHGSSSKACGNRNSRRKNQSHAEPSARMSAMPS